MTARVVSISIVINKWFRNKADIGHSHSGYVGMLKTNTQRGGKMTSNHLNQMMDLRTSQEMSAPSCAFCVMNCEVCSMSYFCQLDFSSQTV